MAWKYEAKDAALGLRAGRYQARVAKVEDKESRAGNPMRVVQFEVYGDPQNVMVSEFFVQGIPFAIHKMKMLAGALGQAKQFEANQFDASEHINSTLFLTLSVDDKGYNRIDEFEPATPGSGPKRVVSSPVGATRADSKPMQEDDIPF